MLRDFGSNRFLGSMDTCCIVKGSCRSRRLSFSEAKIRVEVTCNKSIQLKNRENSLPVRHTSLSTGNLLEMAFLSTVSVDNLKFLKKILTVFLMLNLGKNILSTNCLLNQRPIQ